MRLHWELEPEDGSPLLLADLLRQAHGPVCLPAGTHPGCPDCGSEVDLQQRTKWVEAPLALIIQLVRMRSDHGGNFRDDPLVEVPRLGLEACGAIYDLVAQILHSGSASTGHYTARVLRQGLWWLCDDGYVRRCPKQMVETPAGDTCGLVFT